MNKKIKKWDLNNPEKIKESQKKYYDNHKEKKRELSKKLYVKNKEIKKWQVIFRKYKITKQDFDLIFETQQKRCAICGTSDFSQWILNIDHDHNTGKVRGILCNKCNLGLGSFDDNEWLMLNAIKYLKQFQVDGKTQIKVQT